MRRATSPYARLAAAILIQARRDATATRVTNNPDSTMPTAADVASARDFLTSPAALALAAHLGLHPGYVRRLVARKKSQQVRHPVCDLNSAMDLADPALGAGRHDWLDSEVARFLNVLSPREREVVLLRAREYSYREVADALGISTNSVRTLLARGLRKMRLASGAAPGQYTVAADDADSISKTLQ